VEKAKAPAKADPLKGYVPPFRNKEKKTDAKKKAEEELKP